ncbi:MAG: hypothetical protein ACD_71C00207G0001 [uncultured bacterium (gcode 4)]|uniref:Uncharacterized protein n=1 Tax=uncultured bacterium (gcode 4) TaxID=1234023 RepID=K1Z3X6_9BACT|nr:MAG: hypothetical protein ACD_71C00207G0001 [uncultured bacterium (gcode 4)]
MTLSDIEFVEITELQYATLELPTQEEGVDRRKCHTDEFTVLKRDVLEATVHNPDIGEITVHEGTIRKVRERKITLTEITLLEYAMRKILISQVSRRRDEVLE